MEISIFKAPMWAPRSQAIAYGCTANMICLPIQALEFLQGPAQTPPSPGHLSQQSSQNYLPPVLTNSLIYWADMGIMPNQWQDCPRTFQALVHRCYSPQKPWDRDNAASLESQETRVHLSGHQCMHVPPSRTLRLSMTEARNSSLSPCSKGYGTFFSFLKYYYYNASGTMVGASNPRSWANTSREIAKFKTNLGNSEKLSQNTVEKRGGGFQVCLSDRALM